MVPLVKLLDDLLSKQELWGALFTLEGVGFICLRAMDYIKASQEARGAHGETVH